LVGMQEIDAQNGIVGHVHSQILASGVTAND
jgi:hypothetical protein